MMMSAPVSPVEAPAFGAAEPAKPAAQSHAVSPSCSLVKKVEEEKKENEAGLRAVMTKEQATPAKGLPAGPVAVPAI